MTVTNKQIQQDVVKTTTQEQEIALQHAEPITLAVKEIDFSPLNYRKYYNEQALKDFAAEMKQHGMISPVTVRKKPSGKYELVVGERRLRAAQIGAIETIPAMLVELSDEKVREIQLAENLQRENPHPLDEAQAVLHMQNNKLLLDEIALRLGKSKGFVYTRLKLALLTDPFKEMFYETKIGMQEAIQIATLSTESQLELFEANYKDWKKKKDFRIYNLSYLLSQYQYDLKNAPFNTKDKKLLPDMEACTQCHFNSATVKSLFPEYAKQAICANKECYHRKCRAHIVLDITTAFLTHQPDTLLYNGHLSEELTEILTGLPAISALPQQNVQDVTVIEEPEKPQKENYYNEWQEKPQFNKKAFDQAMEEFKSDLEEYKLMLKKQQLKKGVLVQGNRIQVCYFSLERPKNNTTTGLVTAKQVQEAIKNNTITPALLEAEINRIREKELRSKTLDKEKVHLQIHEALNSQLSEVSGVKKMTEADRIATRLLVYQALDYTNRDQVDKSLFPEKQRRQKYSHKDFYTALSTLTDQQFSYLIRMAISGKSESKYPSQLTGYFLHQVAEQSGVDIKTLQSQQQEKATVREQRQQERLKELKTTIKNMNAKPKAKRA